jgi:hypothetical protein
MVTDVSDKHTACRFRVICILKIKAVCSSEMLLITYQTAWFCNQKTMVRIFTVVKP